MKYIVSILLWCTILHTGIIHAQAIYNLNIENGLPTNHVYNLLADRHGYLWIATQKGIVRYNGYEAKLFNFSDGLHKEDVWKLTEDKRGRIWLSSISRQIGYIKDNHYKAAVNLSGNSLYPMDMRENDEGVFFIPPNFSALYMEKNDTLYEYKNVDGYTRWMLGEHNELFVARNDSLFSIQYILAEGKIKFSNPLYITNDKVLLASFYAYSIGKNFIYSEKGNTAVGIKNKDNGKTSYLNLNNQEKVFYIFPYIDEGQKRRQYALASTKALYIINPALQVKRETAFDTIKEAKGNISFFINNLFWGKVLSTYITGAYINYEQSGDFKELNSITLDDYKYVGSDALKQHYWWNEKNKLLARIGNDLNITIKKYDIIHQAESILRYNKDSSLISGRHVIVWINNSTMAITPFRHGLNITTNTSFPLLAGKYYMEAFKIIAANKTMYLLNSIGISEMVKKSGNNVFVDFFSYERFSDMEYDATRDNLWVYSSDYIEVYKNKKKQFSLFPASLKALGITNVERIIADAHYGNMFLKEHDRLLMFDDNIHQYKTLFDNYILRDAVIEVSGDMLVVAGRFGILFCKITGKGKTGNPVVYKNIKNIVYNYVTDIQVSDSTVLLKTDKKLYTVTIPAPGALDTAPYLAPVQEKYVFTYNDTLLDVHNKDTIRILQDRPGLQLDVINPEGNGKPVYMYKIAGIHTKWVQLAGNELVLPVLKPGKYYKMQLVVSDDVWRSRPLEIILYPIPYWWQQRFWQIVFWSGILISLAFFGIVVARTTRIIVTRANERRNARMELELKAIYSQINPHFIYNTLSSALLLINNKKMEEAYIHVSKFSKLLRAYVRASRNKYITLSDEIINLRNYIELQQTRFKNKFSYSIIAGEDVNIESEKIPSLLLQPFVENAINHGLLNREEPGNLKIGFAMKAKKELVCTIEDDGIGRKASKLINQQIDKQHQSYGEAMIKDLIDIFNRYEHIRIEIKITDKEAPLSGTIVEIMIKRGHHE